MYKLAKKHIIISPSKKPDLSALKAILPILLVFVAAILLFMFLRFPEKQITEEGELKKFSSSQELEEFIKENTEAGNFIGYSTRAVDSFAEPAMIQESGMAKSAEGASDYSTTNIQVEGVDEADIVKNDGKYIYTITGNKISIVEAYPPENMKVLSEINLTPNPREMFINQDKLVVFSSGYDYLPYVYDCVGGTECGGYSRYSNYIHIYDISDREAPELENEYEVEGDYVNSRMIGDYVYSISNKYVYTDNIQPPIYRINGIEEKVLAEEVYYWDYSDNNYVFTTITSINLNNGKHNSEVYLTGYSASIYVSQNNIYLTRNKYIKSEDKFNQQIEEVYYKVLPKTEIKKYRTLLTLNCPSVLK